MDDELHERLERMGQAATPGPDEQFAGRLESHLRATAAAGRGERRGPVLLRPGLVLGALLLIAVAVGALVLGGDDDPDILVIDDAARATVVLPGGGPMTGVPGTELPDGTVIEVGPDGFAVIDGIVLPAGSKATVVMGVVELRLASPTPAPTAIAPTVTVESTPTTAPTATPLPTTAPTSTPLPAQPDPEATPDAPVTTPEPEPEPTPTARPTTAPSATPTPQPTAPPQPTPTAEPEPTPTAEARPTVTLERANLGPRRTQLTWTVTGADAIAGFEVRVRRGDEIRTAAVLREPAARELTVERPQRDRVFYRVVARNAEGEILARSNEVRVTAAG